MFRSKKKKQCIDKIEAAGHKMTRKDVMHVWPIPAHGTSEIPKPRQEYAWLEVGNKARGYEHTIKKHQEDFTGVGIPPEQQHKKLPELMEASSTVGRHVGYTSNKFDRPVMAVYVKEDQQIRRNGMTLGSNGFVVSMNPISAENVRRRPGDPREVSDRTMASLYHYPPNTPERRSTHAQAGATHEPVQQTHKHPTSKW